MEKMYPGRDNYTATGHSLGGRLLQILGLKHPELDVAAFSPFNPGWDKALKNYPDLNKPNINNIHNFGVKGDKLFYEPGLDYAPGLSYYFPGAEGLIAAHMPSGYYDITLAQQISHNNRFIADQPVKEWYNMADPDDAEAWFQHIKIHNANRDWQRFEGLSDSMDIFWGLIAEQKHYREPNPQELKPHYVPQMPSATSNSNLYRSKTEAQPSAANIVHQQNAAPVQTVVVQQSSGGGGGWFSSLFNSVTKIFTTVLSSFIGGGASSVSSQSYPATNSSSENVQTSTTIQWTSNGQTYTYTSND